MKKVQLNSCYGALGNRWFRWYDIRLATSVTLSGQFVIRWIDKRINEYLSNKFGVEADYVVFAHTDSIYLKLDKIVDKLFPDESNRDPKMVVSKLVEVCEELQPVINDIFKSLSSYLNTYESKMNMKIEVIADKAIWEKKNRYALNVYYDEGVMLSYPKLKMVGIETVKSSIPEICRDSITKVLEIIFRKDVDELRRFIRDF